MFRLSSSIAFLIPLVAVMSLWTPLQVHGDAGSGGGIELRSPGSVRKGDIVRVGEDVLVREGEVIDGTVVVVGGDLTVRGRISGDAVCIGGRISLERGADIGGDVVSIGGGISRSEGVRIGGREVDVGGLGGISYRFRRSGFPEHLFGFVGKVIRVGVLILISLLIAALFPAIPTRIASEVRGEWLKLSIIGLVAELLFIPVFIMLCRTVVGIPVAFIVQPLLYILAFLLGFVGVSLAVGGWVNSRISGTERSTPMLAVMGVVAIELVPLLGSFLRAVGAHILGWLLLLVGWTILYSAWTIGLGGVVLALFRRRAPAAGGDEEQHQ